MYLAELYFGIIQPKDASSVVYAIETLLSALYRSGQILDSDYSILRVRRGYATHALLPSESALQPEFHSQPVKEELAGLLQCGLGQPKATLLGRDLSGRAYSEDIDAPFFVLYTYWTTNVTAVRRGDNFEPVPLYLLPPNPETGDHLDIRTWVSVYKACDTLCMTESGVSDGAFTALSAPDSALNVAGRAICTRLERDMGVPFYYALTRGPGKDEERRLEKCCRKSDYEWRLDDPLHSLFDFRCDGQRLLSYLPWGARQAVAAGV
jgi:predicted  nucleic acid-binding Zn ribbon protein